MTAFAKEYELIKFCEKHGVKRVKLDAFEVEFFPSAPTSMELDPVSLSKILTNSMPPDSAMMFAATEDMPDIENPISKPLESPDMS